MDGALPTPSRLGSAGNGVPVAGVGVSWANESEEAEVLGAFGVPSEGKRARTGGGPRGEERDGRLLIDPALVLV